MKEAEAGLKPAAHATLAAWISVTLKASLMMMLAMARLLPS
ncbi:conserved hypothetical protein [Burkholderia pseudomallei 305]|nr:conserved hypothetical protein [Burkholderia pseudomallei 305]EDS86951.1 hypothetical protein BURPSS13_P0677 [Burkholderia pseudomallei S13]